MHFSPHCMLTYHKRRSSPKRAKRSGSSSPLGITLGPSANSPRRAATVGSLEMRTPPAAQGYTKIAFLCVVLVSDCEWVVTWRAVYLLCCRE